MRGEWSLGGLLGLLLLALFLLFAVRSLLREKKAKGETKRVRAMVLKKSVDFPKPPEPTLRGALLRGRAVPEYSVSFLLEEGGRREYSVSADEFESFEEGQNGELLLSGEQYAGFWPEK